MSIIKKLSMAAVLVLGIVSLSGCHLFHRPHHGHHGHRDHGHHGGQHYDQGRYIDSRRLHLY